MPNTRPLLRAIVAIAVVGLPSCAGTRPTLTPQQGPARAVATDPAVIAVSELLENPVDTFTATYTIQPTAADTDPTQATVYRRGADQHVQVGEVDIFSGSSGQLTCTSALAACEPGIADGFLSQLGISHDFWAPAANNRLLTDGARKIGSTSASTETIAGQPSTCVDIPLAGQTASGSVSYCATDSGVLARYVGADTTIELTGLDTTVDDESLVPPTTQAG